jgi:hypothetical protein
MAFRDNEGYLHAHDGVFNSENAIMFSILDHKLSGSLPPWVLMYNYLENCARAKRDTKYKLSHDNLTACYSVGLEYSSQCKKARKDLNSWHPREWAYYNLVEGKDFLGINRLIISLVMFISCARKYKRRTYGNGNKVKLIATDSKILAWLRFSRLDMPITQKICEYFIVKYFGDWKGVFEVYFDKNHPLLKYDRDCYNV